MCSVLYCVVADRAPLVVSSMESKMLPASREIEGMMRGFFDKLRGKSATVDLTAFLKWDQMQDLVDSDMLEANDLDRVLGDVGAIRTKKLTYEQFKNAFQQIHELIDMDDVEGSVDTDEDDVDEEDLPNMSPEQTARVIFDELCLPGAKAITLQAFLNWEEVLALIQLGALFKAKLNEVIVSCGMDVEHPETVHMDFDQVSAIIHCVPICCVDHDVSVLQATVCFGEARGSRQV